MGNSREYYREWEKKHKEHRKEYRKEWKARPGALARASEQNRWRDFREVFRRCGYKVPEYYPMKGK